MVLNLNTRIYVSGLRVVQDDGAGDRGASGVETEGMFCSVNGTGAGHCKPGSLHLEEGTMRMSEKAREQLSVLVEAFRFGKIGQVVKRSVIPMPDVPCAK